eukprot:3412787-Pyramimonas_sp.AAC.1
MMRRRGMVMIMMMVMVLVLWQNSCGYHGRGSATSGLTRERRTSARNSPHLPALVGLLSNADDDDD